MPQHLSLEQAIIILPCQRETPLEQRDALRAVRVVLRQPRRCVVVVCSLKIMAAR